MLTTVTHDPTHESRIRRYRSREPGQASAGGLEWSPALRRNTADKDHPIIQRYAGRTHDALRFEMRMSRLGGDVASLSRQVEQRVNGLGTTTASTERKLADVRDDIVGLRELENETRPRADELA